MCVNVRRILLLYNIWLVISDGNIGNSDSEIQIKFARDPYHANFLFRCHFLALSCVDCELVALFGLGCECIVCPRALFSNSMPAMSQHTCRIFIILAWMPLDWKLTPWLLHSIISWLCMLLLDRLLRARSPFTTLRVNRYEIFMCFLCQWNSPYQHIK